MKLTDLKINKKNPRTIKDRNFRKLMKSLKEFPKMMELRPIIVDDKNMILGGNMRYRALKELGYKEIPDEWIKKASELTDEEKKRIILTDNYQFGEWDKELLKKWDPGQLKNWGLEFEGLDWDPDTLAGKECEYPLIPFYDEKYDAVIIICETKTEIAHLKTRLGIAGKRKSYKNKYLGETNVALYKELNL